MFKNMGLARGRTLSIYNFVIRNHIKFSLRSLSLTLSMHQVAKEEDDNQLGYCEEPCIACYN